MQPKVSHRQLSQGCGTFALGKETTGKQDGDIISIRW